MPEYLHPGVYIEEQPAPQTIEGVSTSTAGFVGAALKGPTIGMPQLVTSFAEFVRRYGSYLSEKDWQDRRFLTYAVEGFFNNGGKRAYIVRVVGPGAESAALTLRDGFVTRLREDTADTTAQRSRVALDSLRGIAQGTPLHFEETIAGNLEQQDVTVTTYDQSTNTVTLDAPLTQRYTRAGAQVTLRGAGAPPAPSGGSESLVIEASSQGEWGRAIRVTVADMNGAVGLAQASGTQTTLRALPLTLANPPTPAANPTTATLDAASAGLLQNGDVVAFEDGAHRVEARTIQKGAGNTITWPGAAPLPGSFGVAGVTARRRTVLRGPIALAFDAAGPATGATNTTLNQASFDRLANNDVVQFRNANEQVERRRITKGAGTQISWTGGGNDALQNDYSGAGATVALVFAGQSVAVENTSGLRPSDLVRVTHGATSEVFSIASAAGSVDAANQQITLVADAVPQRSYGAGDLLALATAGRSASNRLDMSSTNNFYVGAVVEIDDGIHKTYHTVQTIEGRTLVLSSPLGRDVPSGAAVRAVEFSLTVADGTSSETFPNLSMNQAARNFAVTIVNRGSRLVQVQLPGSPSTTAAPFNAPRTSDGLPANLVGGNNGALPIPDNYRGTDNGPGNRTGIKALVDIDEISIIATPGIGDASVQDEMIIQCEELKDRFAVLDPVRGSNMGSGQPNDIIVQRSQHDTLYAAMYYPWLRIRDPLYPNDEEGRLVPPSGHVLGVYARVDVERGVHKAPANEVVRGITGLEVKLGDREQDILNPRNINVIRDFRESNRGIRVWGARCMTTDNAWKYVPVRRLFIFVEESLDEGLQWVVFEPNAEALWARVIQTVRGFLNRVWRDGALMGVTEDEAFFVRCDRSTMTEDDIVNGRLILLVGIAPVRPAEFVIVRIGQKTLEATS